MSNCFTSIIAWPAKRWITAIVTAVLTYLALGIPTAVIENPIFGRAIETTTWSVPVLAITSILAGLLLATYVRVDNYLTEEKSLKVGGIGGLLSFFAIGCPVCNKLVLIALGTSGAMSYFAPIQPYLAFFGIAFLIYAFRKRVLNESACTVDFSKVSTSKGADK
jgi:hypothetical protein